MPNTNSVVKEKVKLMAAEALLKDFQPEKADPEAVVSILIVGVGGQGTLLASRILARAMLFAGADVKVSEVHGMSQRGGSVVTQVRYGPQVNSPLVAVGQANHILAFEKLEALRWLPYLKKGGRLIVNDQSIDPLPVMTGALKYPENILEKIKAEVENTIILNATQLATEIGNARTANVILLGVLASSLNLEMKVWDQALEDSVPEKFLEINRQAFKIGFEMAR